MKSVSPASYTPTLSQSVARHAYSLLLVLLVWPVMLIRLLVSRFRSQAAYARLRQRLGMTSADVPQEGGYLFHCVSVGEVVAASVVIKALQARPNAPPITISTTTATGAERVRAIFGDSVSHCYLPYDFPLLIGSWLKRQSPKAVVITEVELWPNLIHACWAQSRPVVVINARMTDKSARSYRKIPALFTPMLHKLTHVCAQGERDHRNYLSLGLPAHNLTLTNNIKFDQVAALTNDNHAGFLNLARGDRPVIIGGSTHEPEEDALLDMLEALLPDHPNLLLVLVPRHPERFAVVQRLIEQRSLPFISTSANSHIDASCNLVLVDEMGRLNQAYQVATIAFVGGSLADRGGHNALEPAAVSVPVIMGPNTYNNPVICEYLAQQGALYLAEDAKQVTAQCGDWLRNPDAARLAGEAGRAVLEANRGALSKTLDVLSMVRAQSQ
ncbi:3-deoxy-D-manno-octulosonic acid transferase [Alteromonas halophila]|uniref:3-deoxy-D-manno-octulosonic acid transferase n=1 Tax=Alteromonas halophila TaxID=516698 RepID=A0A918MX95_9ALTE|nr:3-deoxy-D-manno-octulosonic acid transferase [Alteromonas halophila]GGW78446.1 3-deoxy-D-manno-octulosonic acid transferase [Alteromonas halophila]